jgi:hemoglobin-like flavoprotein
MDRETVKTLRASFALVAARKVDVAAVFYARLFEVAPAVRPMFKDDMAAQQQKLMTALVQIVETADRPGKLKRYLGEMGARHAAYGAKPEHYDVVGGVLLWTLESILGEGFTPEVRQAWVDAFGAVAQIMTSHARGKAA